MKCLIHLKEDDDYFYRNFNDLLPILKRGCFIISYFEDDGRFEEINKKIKY